MFTQFLAFPRDCAVLNILIGVVVFFGFLLLSVVLHLSYFTSFSFIWSLLSALCFLSFSFTLFCISSFFNFNLYLLIFLLELMAFLIWYFIYKPRRRYKKWIIWSLLLKLIFSLSFFQNFLCLKEVIIWIFNFKVINKLMSLKI